LFQAGFFATNRGLDFWYVGQVANLPHNEPFLYFSRTFLLFFVI